MRMVVRQMILGLVIVSEDGQKKAPKPSNQIDLQALTTFPHVSSDYMSDRVRNKFRTYRYVYEDVPLDGEVVRKISGGGKHCLSDQVKCPRCENFIKTWK